MGVKTVARNIDPSYLKRAMSIQDALVPEHLDSIAMSLQQALDSWRYRSGEQQEVSMCLDAFIALWATVEEQDVD